MARIFGPFPDLPRLHKVRPRALEALARGLRGDTSQIESDRKLFGEIPRLHRLEPRRPSFVARLRQEMEALGYDVGDGPGNGGDPGGGGGLVLLDHRAEEIHQEFPSVVPDLTIPAGTELVVLFSGTRPTVSGLVGQSFVFDAGGPNEADFSLLDGVDNAACNMEVWTLEGPPAGVTADLTFAVNSDTATPLGLYFFGGNAPAVQGVQMFAGTASEAVEVPSETAASASGGIVLASLAVLRVEPVTSGQDDDSAIEGYNTASARRLQQFHAHKPGAPTVGFSWQIDHSGNNRDYAGALVTVHDT